MIEIKKSIKLNFYPITPQEFEFKVWRMKYQQGERIDVDFHRNKLPINGCINKDSEYSNYWVSFEQKEGFEEFICKQDCNNKLTQHFLFYLLHQKIKTSLIQKEYILPDDTFRKELFFVLKEHHQGKETVGLEPYFLQPNKVFGFLMNFEFRKDSNVSFSREIQKLSLSLDNAYRSNRNFYIDKNQKIQEFFNKFKDKVFPLDLGNRNIDISETPSELLTANLETKKYVFRDGLTDISQYRGVENNGPLQEVNKDVVLVFIYRKKDSYLAEDLRKAITGDSCGVLFSGLEKFFKLEIRDIKEISISDFSEDSLVNTVKEVTTIRNNLSDAIIMPIFVNDKLDEKGYYSMKYKLLKENLPVQVVTSQLLGRKDSLKWSASNIALGIFAKIGGKPWKVLPSHERSIIFGIGQAHQKSNGEIKKYFAYSVCTDSSGIYKKINVLGRSDNEEKYLVQLKNNIIKAIEEHFDNGYNKYVLHIPFKIKKNEVEVIYKAVDELVKSKEIQGMDFVVLRINSKNKFFGYAYTNSFVPYESTYTLLSYSPRAYLVWFEGLQYHKETINKRIPGPIYIEFYWSNRELKEDERKKYLQDVLNLSGANWRGFNAKNLPISIYYCQLIAKFIKNFPEEIENVENILNPWFL